MLVIEYLQTYDVVRLSSEMDAVGEPDRWDANRNAHRTCHGLNFRDGHHQKYLVRVRKTMESTVYVKHYYTMAEL
jgi:hypothetical protein